MGAAPPPGSLPSAEREAAAKAMLLLPSTPGLSPTIAEASAGVHRTKFSFIKGKMRRFPRRKHSKGVSLCLLVPPAIPEVIASGSPSRLEEAACTRSFGGRPGFVLPGA